MSLPRISIITPSFNQGRYIGQTIESVLSQGYPDLEYIVMDAGSTDETLDVLRQYAGRLHWISEPDRGQSHAINKGLRLATGEVVAFLNSDDCYRPGALHLVGAYFARNRHVGWLTGKCGIIDPLGRPTRGPITLYKNFWLALRGGALLRVLNFISQPATFWRRELWGRVGDLNESLHYTMDYDYWLRLESQSRLGFINRYLADFRVHPGSKGGTGAARQFAEELETARHYTRSSLLLTLHALHARAIVATYRLIQSPLRSTLSGQ